MRSVVPDGAQTRRLQVRSYETARDGRVRLGSVLRYLEHIATLASNERGFTHRWYEEHGTAWVVREMRLHLGLLPPMDEVLSTATWLSEVRRVQAAREYALALGDRTVVRAVGRWAYIDRVTGVPQRISGEVVERFSVLGHGFPHGDPLAVQAPVQAVESTLRLTARIYEADTQQHINNCVYADWLEEALSLALADPEGAARPLPCLRDVVIEYLRSAQPGEEMVVTTRLAAPIGRRLYAWQEIHREQDGALLVRARMGLLRPLG